VILQNIFAQSKSPSVVEAATRLFSNANPIAAPNLQSDGFGFGLETSMKSAILKFGLLFRAYFLLYTCRAVVEPYHEAAELILSCLILVGRVAEWLKASDSKSHLSTWARVDSLGNQ